MTAALQDHLFAGGRVAEPLHDAFLSRRRLPQHIPGRGGCGRDHEDWWLEHGVDSILQKSGPLLGAKWVARGKAARAMQALVSYHCRRVCGKL